MSYKISTDYSTVYLFFLLFITVLSKQIHLSPYAFWDPVDTAIAVWVNGTEKKFTSSFKDPTILTITANDVLYFSDRFNNRVVVVDLNSPNDSFTIGPSLNFNTTSFNQLHGLSTTNTSLFVLDNDNHRLLKLSLNGTDATTVLNLAGMRFPHYLFVDDDTNIYISDTNDHKILQISPNLEGTRIVAGNGTPALSDSTLAGPYGVFVTDDKTIYAADYHNNRIMNWLPDAFSGTLVAGDETPGPNFTQLHNPTHVFVDRNGYMYIAEDSNHRIVRWAPDSKFGRCIAGCSGYSGAHSTQLKRPHSLAFDSNGSLYVSDFDNRRVQKFQMLNYYIVSHTLAELDPCATWECQGTTIINISTMDPTLFGMSADRIDGSSIDETKLVIKNQDNMNSTISVKLSNLFISSEGSIYVDDIAFKHRLHKWSTNPKLNYSLIANLPKCTNVFIDSKDSIYCSYDQEHKVVKIPFDVTSHNRIITFGNGTNGSSPDLLDSPSGLFVDIHLNLYVADTGNDRIQRFKPGQTNGTTVAGDAVIEGKGLKSPTAIVVDRRGSLYIADCGNHRIVRAEGNSFRCVVGCNWDSNIAFDLSFHPRAFWFDTGGNMFVFDQVNHHIQKFPLRTSFPDNPNITEVAFCGRNWFFEKYVFWLEDSFRGSRLDSELGRYIAKSSCRRRLIYWDPKQVGIYANYSTEQCDLILPCRNDGICLNSDDNQNYSCTCVPGFNGSLCGLDERACKPDTCWNNATCEELSTNEFKCNCEPGWTGKRCEQMIDFCNQTECQNHGVCLPLLNKAICECVDGYYGEFCQETEAEIVIKKAASKSFAYVGIIALCFVAGFVIAFDILKYCFGIDPTREELERTRQKKQAKKRRPVIHRFIYVPAPTDPSTPKRRLSTIEEAPTE